MVQKWIPSVKTKRTYYTHEKLSNLEKNILRIPEAALGKEQAVKQADTYLAYGVEKLLGYVTGQSLPRSYSVNEMKGCPVCGKKIDAFGNYPYLANPLEKPFKLQCPSCYSFFPSNDFDSYYKSGLDDYGVFRYEKADPKFLVNELYPDKSRDFCVDDGLGWVNKEGLKDKSYQWITDKEKGKVWKETTVGDNRYTFIAYFNHWFIWTHMMFNGKSLSMVNSAVSLFRDAYLYTDDKKYADAGTVLLNRIADFYPSFDAAAYKWEDNFRHSGGGGDWGKIIGSIWEGNIVDNMTKAYDAFFPAIDEKTKDLLSSMNIYKSNPLEPTTSDDIKDNIENNLLRQILPEVRNRRIRGNVGMHQSSIALSALVLQNSGYFEESMDAILLTTDRQAWGVGNILKILTDDIDHDGIGTETSSGYNALWLNGIHTIAQILKGTGRDLYKHPKFLKMFQMDIPYLICNNKTLNLGDSGNAGQLSLSINTRPLLSYFQQTGNVKAAQLLHLARQKTGKLVEGSMEDWFLDMDQLEKDIDTKVKEHGPFCSESKNYSGFGLAKLEFRNEIEPKCVFMYYGRNTGHGHRDTLMPGIHAFGLHMNPDHGYPALTDGNNEEMRWTKNISSHDTVMVDSLPGQSHIVGIPRHFYPGTHIGVMDVEAPLVYKQTQCYRRTILSVNLENEFYIVDFFRVQGGHDHKYIFHGGEGSVTTTGLNLVPQEKGTYAGVDVEFASPSYDKEQFDGFNYLYDVRKDEKLKGQFSVEWKLKDTWGVWDRERDVRLALTMASDGSEVSLAQGSPPANKPGNPKEFTYMIVRSRGEDIQSCFTAVLEGFENQKDVVKVENIPVFHEGVMEDFAAKALRITLASGRVDTVFNAMDNRAYTTEDGSAFQGFTAVISQKNDDIYQIFFHDMDFCSFKGRVLCSQNPTVYGVVTDFTKEPDIKNRIEVEFDQIVDPSSLAGKYIDIETDKIRNGFYEILSAEKAGEETFSLDIGDCTLIRGYKDPLDFDKGYLYNIKEGARIRIPM